MEDKETIQSKVSKLISAFYEEEHGNRVSKYSLETLGNQVIKLVGTEINTIVSSLQDTNNKLKEEIEMLNTDIVTLQNRNAKEVSS
jgi:hypothetical protein